MWEVIGQEGAVSLLKHSLDENRLSHAYLFIGPPHIGKMTLAKNLAQALNCRFEEKPCRECDACKKILEDKHSDVQVIDLAHNEEADTERKLIGVEQIDGILHDASLPPFEGSYKVFIIEKAELLSIGAANRLLKTLEEPEAKVVFILLTTDEKRLLKTVVSRCQRIELKPMPLEEEAKVLEEKGATAEQARLLAGLSHGCLGWAITASGDPQILTNRQEMLEEIIGIVKGDSEGRFAYAAKLAAGFTQNRQGVYDTLDMYRDLWRDLLLVKTDCAGMITNIDRQDELAKMAAGYSLRQIRSAIKSIESAAEQLRQNVNQRLALEVMMLDLPRLEVKASPVV